MQAAKKLDDNFWKVMQQYNDLRNRVDEINSLRAEIKRSSGYYSTHDFTDDQFIDVMRMVDRNDKLTKEFKEACDDFRIDAGLLQIAFDRYKRGNFDAEL